NVSYSDASGGKTMYAATSTDGGNNTNWLFASVTITWDGSESIDWDTAANWDLNREPVEGDDVIIPSSGVTNEPTLSTADIIGSLTLATGRTLTCNNDLTVVSNVDIDATLDLNTTTFTVGGSIDFTGGTIQEDTSTILLNPSSGTKTFTTDTEILNNLTINDGGGGATLELQDTLTLSGNLTLTQGTLDANDQTLSINGNTVINGGTLKTGTGVVTFGDAADDTLTISSGDLHLESDNTTTDIVKNAGTWTNSGGTITYNAATGVTTNLLSSLSSYYNLTLNSSGSSYTSDGAITAANNLTLTNGTLNTSTNNLTATGNLLVNGGTLNASNASCDLDIGGNVTVSSGTLSAPAALDDTSFTAGGSWEISGTGIFTHNSGRVLLDASSTGKTITTSSSGTDDLYDVKFNNSSGSWTLQDELTVSNDFYLTLGTLDMNDNNLTITGDYTQSSGTFTSGSGTLRVDTNFTKSGGTFNEDTGTITFGGITDGTIDVDSTETFNNVSVNKTTDVSDTLTITSGDTIVATGTLNLTDGEVDTGTIEAQGDVTVGASFNQGNAPMTFSGTNDQTITLTSDNLPTGTLTVNKSSNTATTSGTLTLTGALTIQEGTFSLGGDTNFNGGVTVENGGTLSSTTGGITITIDDADTVTVNAGGNFTLQGASGNLIVLQSDTTEAWNLVMNGLYDMDYINVSYSDASGGRTMYAATSTDGGNNTNWVFAGATITWDGSASSDWDTAANWDLNRTPTDADDVVISVNGTVNLPSSTRINSLSLDNTVDGTTCTFNFTYDAITNGALIIDDGDLTVYAGANITHSAGTTTVVGTVNLDVETGDAAIYGTINVNARGYQHSEGPGQGINGQRAGGAGYGGDGGDGNVGAGGSAYGSVTEPTDLGSGGGDYYPGGAGGGAVKLTIAGTTTIAGTIFSNGATGGGDAGGGSGGSVYITTGTLDGAGTITANGGSGQDTYAGGGGGGRIAVHYTTDNSSVTYQAYGGLAGGSTSRMGGAGTIYTKAVAQSNGDLTIDNNDYNNLSDGAFGRTPINETITFDTITIKNYGNLETGSSTNITYTTLDWSTKGTITDLGGTFDLLSGGGALLVPATSRLYFYTSRTPSSCTINGWVETRHAITTAGDFSIGTAGTLTHEYNSTTQQYVIDITAANFNLSAGGIINVNARGYQHSAGPGEGTNGQRAGGAGYGGDGGDGNVGAGGSAYGSVTEPTDLGSGGGDYYPGGAGGGAVKLTIAGTTTIAGTIFSNGATGGGDAGGGSGGSVYITTGTLDGAGTITANGGSGQDIYAGGGGGG
ncbi:MAG: hypothetical protein KAS59_07535, partial [Alphaproteobacteria bacterium]|nr:hypothetical protein [Alphaproteobacteria bacterium]